VTSIAFKGTITRHNLGYNCALFGDMLVEPFSTTLGLTSCKPIKNCEKESIYLQKSELI